MANNVRIGTQVTGVAKSSSELDRLKDKFTGLQKQGAKGLAIGVGVAATTAGLNILSNALGNVTDFVGEATDAFIKDEASQAKLRTSLRANVAAWGGNADAIEKVLTERMKLGFSDDEQRESLSGLVAAYGDVAKALDVEREAMDLARFSGVDLATASDVLIKVHAGNYRALKALGIQTDDIHNETEALAAIQKVATGQAESYTKTLEGRLTVANVKAAEATEHLGAKTAELSADFDEAKASAIDNFATGLDFLADGLNASNQSLERQGELAKVLIGLNPLLSDSQKAAATAAIDEQVAQDKLNAAMSDLSHFAGKAADDVAVLGSTSSGANPKVDRLSMTVEELGAAVDKTRGEIRDLSSAIDDELFGKAINAGHEAQLKDNIKDLVKQREAAHKGSLKWLELTGQIAENRQELFNLHLEEAAKAGPQAAIDFLKKEKLHAGNAKDEIQKLIDKYQALADLQGDLGPIIVLGSAGTGGKSGSSKHRASGGPVTKGEMYTVGEHGPETFVAPTNGSIIPTGGGMPGATGGSSSGGAMGGGGLTIIVQGVSVMTPGSTEALARQLEPIITRAQQQRGHVRAARAF